MKKFTIKALNELETAATVDRTSMAQLKETIKTHGVGEVIKYVRWLSRQASMTASFVLSYDWEDQVEALAYSMKAKEDKEAAALTPYLVVLADTNESITAVGEQDLLAKLAAKGFTMVGRQEPYTQLSEVLHTQPVFKGLCGPMKDGSKIRYEDWKAYDYFSR